MAPWVRDLHEYPGHEVHRVDPLASGRLVACVEQRRYVALDRSCTHGGAQCAYDHGRRSLRCTSLNHAEYALDGTLLHGRTHGDLRAYEARCNGSRLEIRLGRRP